MLTRSNLFFGALALMFAGSVGSWASTREAAADEAAVDVSVFYTSLEPYGNWVQLETYGWAFVPAASGSM